MFNLVDFVGHAGAGKSSFLFAFLREMDRLGDRVVVRVSQCGKTMLHSVQLQVTCLRINPRFNMPRRNNSTFVFGTLQFGEMDTMEGRDVVMAGKS